MTSSGRLSTTGAANASRAQRRETQQATQQEGEGAGGLHSAPLSDPTSGGRTMYFGESQESVDIDPDLEAMCDDGWTRQKSEKSVRVSVSLTRHD